LRRTNAIRINSHNVSEHSQFDPRAHARTRNPKGAPAYQTHSPGQTFNRTTGSGVSPRHHRRIPAMAFELSRSHAPRDAPEPDSP